MKAKIKSLFMALHTWQIVLLSIIGAVIITDLITALASLLIWHEIQIRLIVLGTINAVLVPLIILPMIIRNLRYVLKLEEQNQSHMETISQLESERQIEASLQRRAEEMSLLYSLGGSLASGRDLMTTLIALQTEICKLIEVDALFVAIHNENTDILDFPIFFEGNNFMPYPSRRLSENPGLTGAVIQRGESLYIPDVMADVVVDQYAPVDDRGMTIRTFLGIPLIVNGKIIGVISIQSLKVDAYSKDQIQLMENVAVQAAIAIEKANLLDRLKQELAERKRAEDQLRERELILEAVTFAAEQFLKMPDWRVNIDLVLKRLGKTLKATHAYLFEDHLNQHGELVTSMRYEWTAAGYASDLDGPYFQNSKVYQPGYEDQLEALKRGEVRVGNTSTFNPIEKESMDSLGVKSLLEVPIFVNEREWGAIGFDDFEQEREWSTAEVEALKIAAGVLSAAIQRQEAESAVHEAERIFRRAIEAADAVPYYQDYKSNGYLFMGEGIFEMTGYLPAEISPASWSDMVLETILLGEAAGLSTADAIAFVRQGKIKAWKCDQKIRTRDGRLRWLTDRSVELVDDQGVSSGSIGILQDITDRKLVEADLRQREAILEAVTFAAEQFLKTPDWRLNIEAVLERLGSTLHATHAYLFEHHLNAGEVEYSRLKYEWTAPGHPSDFENPYYQRANPIQLDEESTDHALRRGNIFVGNFATFPASDRDRLRALGVKAMVEAPLFVDGKWWGTLGFDDFENEREWSSAELDALKVATGILSAAIQRQQAEAAVRESERIYRRAIEAAGAVPYYIDYESGRYLFMGEGIHQMIGYRPEEMTLALWRQSVQETIMQGEAAGLNVSEAARLAREGKIKIWRSDVEIQTRDGQYRWLSDSGIELFGDQNISYAAIGILQDITDRKVTEANLRKRESVLEAITFAAEQFLKTSDWRARIEVVLERLGREFNASHAYLFEKHKGPGGETLSTMTYEWTAPECISDLGNPEFQDMAPRPMGFERLYAILDGGEPLIGSVSFFTAAEREYLRSINVRALLEIRVVVNGAHWGTIGFDDIIHEREWTAMEVDVIRVAANVLGAAVKRQMDEAALQNELDERQKLIGELEHKNSELERFTYTVSHDLKSPLVTINGFLGYLEQDAASGNVERLKKDTQRIQEAVNKMQRLLNELLELSRIGRIVNISEMVPFNELVREAMNIVHGQLESHRVTVHTQPNLPTVYGDKPRLTEVLQNLLDNAAKYMGDQPSPRIEIGQRGNENGQPVFFIRDNGIGIAPQFHERVFGLFDKLDPKSEGTGVGLALVKRIIEVHGGRIWVESELGQGSAFYLTLPGKENPQ